MAFVRWGRTPGCAPASSGRWRRGILANFSAGQRVFCGSLDGVVAVPHTGVAEADAGDGAQINAGSVSGSVHLVARS